jgi:hypothetical protein
MLPLHSVELGAGLGWNVGECCVSQWTCVVGSGMGC